MVSWYVRVNLARALRLARWALVVSGYAIVHRPLPAFGLSGAGIYTVRNQFDGEVDDGDGHGHQCWDPAHCIQRGIGVHVTTTARRGSIAIE